MMLGEKAVCSLNYILLYYIRPYILHNVSLLFSYIIYSYVNILCEYYVMYASFYVYISHKCLDII